MPGQQGGGGNDPMSAQLAREQAGQRGQYRPVRPGGSRPAGLTPQHRDLVAQDQNLHILESAAASEQSEPAEHRAREQIQQSEQHGQ